MRRTTGLSGKVVVITGAGSGIGRATALRFPAEDARLVLTDINADGAATVAEEITAACANDVLVNNAGIMDRMSAADPVGAGRGQVVCAAGQCW